MKDKLEHVEKLVKEIKESDCCVILTPSTCCVNGTGAEILTLLSCFVDQMKDNGFEKQMILDAVEIGWLGQEERKDNLKDLLKELLDKLD